MPGVEAVARNQDVRANSPETEAVEALISAGRRAMLEFSREINVYGQSRIDEAVTALAWSIYKPENARSLAEVAVDVTGIGDIESKVLKNQRKTFGTLRDLLRVKSTGVIEENPEKGLIKYAKPVGVVGAITPSTNPSATPVNKAMMALKGGNAIIIAPPPTAWKATKPAVDGMRRELEKIGLPANLVQILPSPVTRAMTADLMEHGPIWSSSPAARSTSAKPTSQASRRSASAWATRRLLSMPPPTCPTRRTRSCCRRLSTTRRRARPRTRSSFSIKSMTRRSTPSGRRAAISRLPTSANASPSGCGRTASSIVR